MSPLFLRCILLIRCGVYSKAVFDRINKVTTCLLEVILPFCPIFKCKNIVFGSL